MKQYAWLFAALFGVALAAIVGIGIASAQDDDDEGEVEETVALSEIPDAVKATILTEVLQEVKDLELLELERETENGVTVYEAEFQYNGSRFELEISPDGELLEKETGEDEEEDDDV